MKVLVTSAHAATTSAGAASKPAVLVARTRDDGAPFQPPVGSITYTRADGTTKDIPVMPFLPDPAPWATPYDTFKAAVDAANGKSYRWDGRITFGVVQAKEGHFLIRPMETKNGYPFVIDRHLLPEAGAVKVAGTATDPAFLAIVGTDDWLDFRTSRTDVGPVPIKV